MLVGTWNATVIVTKCVGRIGQNRRLHSLINASLSSEYVRVYTRFMPQFPALPVLVYMHICTLNRVILAILCRVLTMQDYVLVHELYIAFFIICIYLYLFVFICIRTKEYNTITCTHVISLDLLAINGLALSTPKYLSGDVCVSICNPIN